VDDLLQRLFVLPDVDDQHSGQHGHDDGQERNDDDEADWFFARPRGRPHLRATGVTAARPGRRRAGGGAAAVVELAVGVHLVECLEVVVVVVAILHLVVGVFAFALGQVRGRVVGRVARWRRRRCNVLDSWVARRRKRNRASRRFVYILASQC
jgi:hypothetical protein